MSSNLKSEADRYKTFDTWPVTFINKYKLAAAGFYYFNRGDIVRCIFCRVEVGNWEEGDDPFREHKRWKPSCPYLRRLPVGNIPRDANNPDITPVADVRSVYDVCGLYGLEIRPNSSRENFGNLSNKETSLKKVEMNRAGRPVHSLYVLRNKGKEFVANVIGGTTCVSSEEVQNIQVPSELKKSSLIEESVKSATGVEAETQTCKTADKKGGNNPLLCKICFEEQRGVLFLPCGHLVACVKCAPSLKTCAVCCQPFTAIARAFLS